MLNSMHSKGKLSAYQLLPHIYGETHIVLSEKLGDYSTDDSQPAAEFLAGAVQMLETPLSRAAHNGHLHTVQYLTEQGADVNCLDLVGRTATVILYITHPVNDLVKNICMIHGPCNSMQRHSSWTSMLMQVRLSSTNACYSPMTDQLCPPCLPETLHF